MLWAAKTYPMGGETEAVKNFRRLFAKHKLAKGMMLVSEHIERKLRLLAGVPSEALLTQLPGFKRVTVGQFPTRASVSLLLGDQEEFDKWFSRSSGGG